MIRIFLCVVFAALLLTNPPVIARKAGHAPASAGTSTQTHATDRHADASVHAAGRRVPAHEPRVRTRTPTRPGSLRWHSFLPGMFR